MLAEGIAFVALRRRSLYHAQVRTKRESPAHRHDLLLPALDGKRVSDLPIARLQYVAFRQATPGGEVLQKIAGTDCQLIFPVLDGASRICGMINADVLRTLATEQEVAGLTVAADLMEPPLLVRQDDDLHTAIELMLRHHLREVVVTDETGKIVGFMDESDITRAYIEELGAKEKV